MKYDRKCTLGFMNSTGYSCQILMTLEVFEKHMQPVS